LGQRFCDLRSPVGTAIIDDGVFPIAVALPNDAVSARVEKRCAVVNRRHHTDQRSHSPLPNIASRLLAGVLQQRQGRARSLMPLTVARSGRTSTQLTLSTINQALSGRAVPPTGPHQLPRNRKAWPRRAPGNDAQARVSLRVKCPPKLASTLLIVFKPHAVSPGRSRLHASPRGATL